ncbi:MAG: DNA repair protein RadC [bacterium]
MKIKDIYKGDRPRERLLKFGPTKLKDFELLAIVIGNGTKGKNVIELSKSILRNRSVKHLAKLEFNELLKIKGIGSVTASKIFAAIEFANRIKNKSSTIIYSPNDIWKELKDTAYKNKEYFIVFCLDSRNKIIKKELISIGTLNTSLVHPREVFEPAIKNLSAQIVIAHNHPSGDVNPSEEDIEITNKLLKAGILLGIQIMDHVIVSKNKFLSFKARGYL